MAQLASNLVQEPFGEVNAWVHPDGTIEVKATVLMKPVVEHARTGLAIDASASMAEMFGCGKQVISNIFGELCAQPNYVEPVARKMTAYLAEFDSTGETTVIYYSLGRQNMQTEGKPAQIFTLSEIWMPGEAKRRSLKCPPTPEPAPA